MTSDSRISRRVFLARSAGLTLTLGAGSIWYPESARAARNPYTRGAWLAGDHHIHTRFSGDGLYNIEEQVAHAAKYGLGWCVITDHGGVHHDKIALNQAYPELVEARKKHPEILVFQGVEWNVPAAEHASVILPPTDNEAQLISDFEAHFDRNNISLHATPPDSEADAIAGIKYLQSLNPKPLFMANHPARNGVDSPHEMRGWADAGPDVVRGFEGAPGHQAATMTGRHRGDYDNDGGSDAFPGYPKESYRTWGGYDWYVTTIGGLWDSLLGEGRPWYITCDSDSHRHWDDRRLIDESTYETKGYATVLDKLAEKNIYQDFYPGEYSKTWVHAEQRSHHAVLEALRHGHMFTVLGGLVDRCELFAHTKSRSAPMGDTLKLERRGEEVIVNIRVRVPKGTNFGGIVPRLHHLDIIAGDILGLTSDRNLMTNPTTKLVAQLDIADAGRDGEYITFEHKFSNVQKSFYVRVRGTNTDVDAPRMDLPDAKPWEDLWFYSNPVMIEVV